MKGKNIFQIILVLEVTITLVSVSWYTLTLDQNEKVIAEANSVSNILRDNILLWSKTNKNEKQIFYWNLDNNQKIELSDQIKGKYLYDFEYQNILWGDLLGNRISIHLYNVTTKQDILISDEVNRTGTAWGPLISNNLIIWFNGEPQYLPADKATLFIYNILTRETHMLLTGIDMLRGKSFDNSMLVFLHDGYKNLTVFDFNAKHSYTLGIHNISYFSLKGNKIVIIQYLNDEDSLMFLYDIYTRQYQELKTGEHEYVAPDLSEDNIVWMGGASFSKPIQNWDIFLYNIQSKFTKKLTSTYANELSPHISGKYITWIVSREGIKTDQLILYIL